MKKIIITLLILIPFLSIAQDKVINITIAQPSAALTISGGTTPATGNGLSTGAVNTTVSGGTAGYSYVWSQTGNPSFSATSPDLTNVLAGTYSVLVTDANSCTASAQYTVNQPPPLNVNITNPIIISCFGDNDGQLLVTASGGAGSNSFLWEKLISGSYQNAGTGPTLNSQSAGQYRVTVTDGNGISAQDTFILNQPSQLTVNSTKTDVVCFGANTGAINLTISGGTETYTVDWLDLAGANNPVDRTNLLAGDYAYSISDANGCTVDNYSSVITILQPTTAVEITAVANGIQNPSADGATNGSININVTGGTGNYVYSWSNGAVTQDISNLAEGTYTINVKDVPNNCTDSATFTLNDPPPFNVSINTTQIILCNGGTGVLQATATGGVPNPGPSYNYDWFNLNSGTPVSIGITTATASNLSSGNYRVVATDNNGNTTSADQLLIEPTSLVLSTPTSSNVLCFDGNDGSASIIASGGTTNYTYTWTKTEDASYTATTPSINTLTAGTYNLTVTDANSCTASTSVTIMEPTSAVFTTLVNQTNVLINGQSTGAIDINVSGGTASYNYLWTKAGDASFNETTQDLTNLGAGEYTIVVNDSNATSSSNAGCIATQTFTITEPAVLNVLASISNSIDCFEDTDGQLTATVSGGVGPYTYAWFEIIAGVSTDLEVSTDIISGQSTGEYQVQVVDANGAATSYTILLTEPSKLIASVTSTTNVNCFGDATGSIDISVSGGTGNYTYSWSDANGPLTNTTQDLANLVIGNYSVSIQDENGCLVSLSSIMITQPLTPLNIATNPIISEVSGNGLTNGSIDVTVTGGTTPYTYLWTDTLGTTLTSTTNILDNIGAGSYFLMITDANGCIINSVEYNVTEPAPLIAPISIVSISCFGETGTLTASASGGVAPYDYNWYNVLDNTTTLSNNNVLTAIAGEYALIVTDANGIVNSQNIILSEPDDLIVTATQTNVLCNGEATGSINLTVTGGTGAYTYNWSNTATTQAISGLIAGTYSVTVRDANFCEAIISVTITQPTTAVNVNPVPIITNPLGNGLQNGSIEVAVSGGISPYTYVWEDALGVTLTSTTNVLNNIGAGSYFLTVTDANGCFTGPIDYTVNQPLPLNVVISNPLNTIACFGETGTLTALVSGGVSDYSYNWFNVLDNTITLSNTNALTAIAGNYTLVVTDANGIQNTQNITLSEPTELLIDPNSIIINNVNCYNGSDGSIEINVNGGTGMYTYLWSNNGSLTNIQNGLSAGIYSVTVTDELGCNAQSGPITITQPEGFLISAALLIRPSNTGTLDGSIAIDITGGIAPFDYQWFDALGNSIQQTQNSSLLSNTINNINEGQYTIVITDDTGCAITTNYNLANPGELLLSVNLIQAISCFGGNNGILEVETIGGAGGNNYAWYNATDDSQIGGNSQILNNVAPGSYYVIVSNADGLQEQSNAIQVTQPDVIATSLSQTNPTCFDNNDGSITISAIGGSGIYEYNYQVNGGGYSDNWFAFDTNFSSIITTLVAGNYDIRIRDSLGCFYEIDGSVGTLSTTLTQPDDFTINNTQNNPTGFGLTNGSIEVSVSGGTLPYSYSWSDANGTLLETTNTVSNLGAGNYTVLITDINNCTVEQTYTLTQPQALMVAIQNVNVILCNGDNGASLNALSTGGVLPYSYQWFEAGNTTTIGTSQLLENIGAANYYVVITDANSNMVQSTLSSVSEPDVLNISLLSNFSLCGDGNDWEINSNISGGTEPYNYTWSNGSSESNIFNVLPGDYTLTVTDANGCLQSESIRLVPPPALSISETITNPTCFQSTDGSIEINSNGGTLPYSYLWNSGETTANISNLSSGTYQLTITDFKGCEIIQTFVLTDPEALVLDLGEDVTLCRDQSVIIDATIPDGISYQWSSSNGFTSTDQVVELSLEGTYSVTAINAIGCIARDEITVIASSDVIAAEFLVSSQVFVNEAFYIIDDSNPIPDEVIWVLPEEVEIISEENTFAEIIFDTPGEYEITMITIIGNCSKSQTKKILVIEREGFSGEVPNGLRPIISDFKIFPNPSSNGNFNVNIELGEILPISLKIFGLVNNTMMDYRVLEGESSYQTNYELNVPSGVYFIILETAFATQLQKIIIE